MAWYSAYMHEIKVFENGPLGVEVRSLRKDGQTWLVLMDVARVFGYRDSGRVLHLLRDSQYIQADEDIKEDLGVRGRAPYLVSEGGFYRLALSSTRPEAEPFQIWVEEEVLPTLRKGYEAGIDVLEETRARVAELEKRNERLEVAAKEADEYAVGVYNTMVRYQKETDRENRYQKEEWEKAKDFWANAYMAMREEAGRICEEYGISEDRLPIV
jgi:prophage antirepressor-like protein